MKKRERLKGENDDEEMSRIKKKVKNIISL